MSRRIPTGTVTFLFSDIEGSTELVQRLGPAAYRDLLEQHQRLLRTAFAAHGGVERGTQGDSFLVVFSDAPAAVAAAVDGQRALATASWPQDLQVRVRMGLHSGEGIPGGDDYVGIDINRAARIAAVAHGGQVLVSDATRALSERSLPTGVDLRDLGVHRLKGLAQPERLRQLTIEGLRSDFPPVRSLSRAASDLPARMTTFVGREVEQQDLLRMLGEHRLITLLGAGGTGKTSLAVEVVRAAAPHFADGAWFVALEAISDPLLVGSAIVRALGLRDVSGRPAREQLLDNLSGRELLLVLDNFEQVVEAASFVGELLGRTQAVKIMVTSRAPLHIGGEQLFRVAPLPVPGAVAPPSIESVASVRLFVDRARQVEPSFALTADNIEAVAEICRRLDGLPLGIELAAARISLLGPHGIRDRLRGVVDLPGSAPRDAPARQRTLRDTIAWSYGLLDAAAKTVFARLSVFSGGCRLEQMGAVCGSGAEAADVVVAIAADLADQSLVTTSARSGGSRVEMLETIREFAAARQAEASDTAEVRGRHALAYLALAEESARSLPGRGQITVLDRLAEEGDNLRAAIRWSVEMLNPEVGLRLVSALWRYWQFRGELAEGRSTVAAVLEIPGAQAPTRYRMRALEASGGLFYWSGQSEPASEMYRAQLELARQLGDRAGEADAKGNLGFTQLTQDKWQETQAMLEEITETYRSLGDERSLARTTYGRAGLLAAQGHAAEAKALMEQAIARYRELEDLYYEGIAAGLLGGLSLMEGDYAGLSRWSLVWIKVSQELGDTPTLMRILFAGIQLAFISGLPEAAATLLAAHTTLSRRFGIVSAMDAQYVPGWTGEEPLERAHKTLDPAAFGLATSLGESMSLDEAVALLVDVSEKIAKPS